MPCKTERRDSMLTTPTEILSTFPGERTGMQHQVFRDAVQAYAETLGYPCQTENKWLLIGDSSEADYIICAGDEDSSVMTILEILRILPENRRSRSAGDHRHSPFPVSREYSAGILGASLSVRKWGFCLLRQRDRRDLQRQTGLCRVVRGAAAAGV